MRSIYLFMLLLPLMTGAQKFEQLSVRDAGKLSMPFMADSIDMEGKKFEKAQLLDSRISTKNLYPTSIVNADTAGFVTLARPESGMKMYVVESRIRPERFTKGQIEVTSDAMYELFIDGNSEVKKTTVQDSIDSESKKSAQITMKPESEHVVTLKVIADEEMESAPMIKIEFIPNEEFADIPVKISTDGKRRFEMRDLAEGCRVSSTSISPDGKYIMIKYRDTYDHKNSRSYATLTDLRTGQVIHNNLNTQYEWMPKGSRLYYTSKGRDGYDVYAVDPATMQESLLMTNVPSGDIIWGPTEDYLIYYEFKKGKAPTAPLRRYSDPDDRIPGNNDRSYAMIYRPETGVAQPLIFGKRSTYLYDISSDGKKALVGVGDYDSTEWPFYFNNLYQVSLTDMAIDTLLTHDADFHSGIYSPDGKKIFMVCGPDAFQGIGLNAGNHPIANFEDLQGYIYDIATAKAKPMTVNFNPSLTDKVTWNAADNMIYFLADNGFDNTVYSLNPESGKIVQLPQDVTYIQRFSIGNEESQWLSYNGQSYDTNGRAYLVDLKTGKSRLIADPWHDIAEQIDWGKTQQWNFTASDGTEIEGFITYPPDYNPSRKYPMIVYYYGGTAPTKHNTYSPYNAQIYASRDYIVYQLNPSGTTGYGQEFSSRHVNAWGDRTIDDIIEGVTALCNYLPSIDRDKIGCVGASYGGFITQLLQTKTDIFAAAISHAGISNVTSYWGEGYWGYSYNALAAAKSYPWDNPNLYTQHGSLFNADKIHTPLLLTHGSADTNVPIGESIQLYNALKILGREVEMVTVDNEDHYVSDLDKRLEWQDAMMAWFAKWLQDDPKWWNEIFGTSN